MRAASRSEGRTGSFCASEKKGKNLLRNPNCTTCRFMDRSQNPTEAVSGSRRESHISTIREATLTRKVICHDRKNKRCGRPLWTNQTPRSKHRPLCSEGKRTPQPPQGGTYIANCYL